MNIFKLGLLLISSIGFGYGIEQVVTSGQTPNTDGYNYDYMENHCFNGELFLDHMLEDLSEEDQLIVQAKIDELLAFYDVTLEELYENYEIRYDFMNDLMTFLDENEIDYHHNYYDDEDGWHTGMGMH